MLKAIPISAILVLAIMTANAQDNDNTITPASPDSTITTPVNTDGSTTVAPANGLPPTNGTMPSTDGSNVSTPTTTITPTGVNGTADTTTGTIDTTTTTTGPNPTITTTPGTTVAPATTTTDTNTAPASGVLNTTTTPTTTTSQTTSIGMPTTLMCVGTTPNWNLTIAKGLITYSSAKSPTLKIRSAVPMTPVGDTSGTVQAYSVRTNSGKAITILVRKNDTGCTNGQTGQSYQYDAFVVFPNMTVAGCCNPA